MEESRKHPLSGGRIDSRLRQARIRASLFQRTPEKLQIGRFTLLERVGAGSMGEVFAAYDERLDRKVAIKLVRGHFKGSSAANERLLLEARTLARLSHPNVVQIYDTGIFEGRVFIAMEFIRGQTMSQWVESLQVRGRERAQVILDNFAAAGRGLQAAHEVGLTHRDFKPDNILVSDSGRVVVVDFGLARFAQERDADVSDVDGGAPMARADRASQTDEHDLAIATTDVAGLTPRGMVLGTPAYMAPEVYEGQVADARSDQFSFCVALHEALHGKRPFQGKDLNELRSAILAGRVTDSGRDTAIPTGVRRALERGLSKDPEQRFPDMGVLLLRLKHRSRRRLVVPILLCIAAVAATFRYAPTRADEPCTSAGAELASVFEPGRRASIEGRFARLVHPYARDAWPLVAGGLHRYAGKWRENHRDACMAHREGRQSGHLLDARMACLDNRRQALDAALTVLEEIDEDSLDNAVQVVELLPAIEHCADTQALNAEVPPPEEPETRSEVDELRGRLTDASALESAGRYDEALNVVESVTARIESINYRPLLGELRLVKGRVLVRMGAREDSLEPLRQALDVGLEEGMDVLAVEAWARWLYARGTLEDVGPEVLAFSSTIEAFSQRLPDTSFGRALLYNNIGTVQMALQDRKQARQYFELALAVRQLGGEAADNFELINVAQNVAMVHPDAERRERLMRDVAVELEETLGQSHPQAISQRVTYASYIGEPERAYETLEPACARYRQSGRPELLDPLLGCLYLLSFVSAEVGDTQRSGALLDELFARIPPDDARYRKLELMARGYAALYRGRSRDALAAFTQARATLPETADAWWVAKDIGDAQLAVGEAHLALAEHNAAIAHLDDARAMFERVVANSYNVEYGHRLAAARWALARALRAQHQQKSRPDGATANVDDGALPAPARRRIVEQVDAVRAWYRATGQHKRMGELDRFVEGLGESPQTTTTPMPTR